jgi:phosphotransferase family enzyme
MTTLGEAASPFGLHALRTAVDTDTMSRRLAPFLGDGSDSRVIAARIVTCVPEKRAVIAYEMSAKDRAGTTLIGKLYAEADRARRLYAVLEQLHALSAAGRECRVARPIAFMPELGMAVHEAVHGRTLDRLDGEKRRKGVIAAALWLSALHKSGIALERRLDMASEMRKLNGWAHVVTHHHPSLGSRTAQLLRELDSLARHIDVATGVPVHEDFHYQHVLVDKGRVVVIDLDEMRAGDPAFDVAHFGANLRLLAIREGVSAEAARRLDMAFLDAYASCAPYEPDARHRFFHGYTCLKIARQLVSRRGPTPVPIAAELSRQLELIIEEGLSCLPR